ncbi:hypothetical protein AAC387_Pa03g0446 [Persea americana]
MKMKPSTQLLPFFFILLLSTTQGIRFQPESLSQSHQQIQQERSSIEGSAIGEVVICNDGHCSGRSRKLMTMAKSNTESAKNKGVEVQATTNNTSSKVESTSEKLDIEPPISEHQKSPVLEHRQSADEHYPDIIDIAGMDYSPAKRKPPIHN